MKSPNELAKERIMAAIDAMIATATEPYLAEIKMNRNRVAKFLKIPRDQKG